MRSWDLQQALYARIKSAMGPRSATGVYDHVPQDAQMPYVVVGDDIATPDDTDDSCDSQHGITIHTWSAHRGQRETKEIQQAIYAALHRESLLVGSAVVVDCHLESQETFLDEDGLTRHGVQRFRVLLDGVKA